MAEATIQRPDRDVYVRNLCALWEVDARLALAVEAVHPEDVPVVERAREGGWTVRVEIAREAQDAKRETRNAKLETQNEVGVGRSVYLHSRYRPVAEGEAWAAGQGCENRYAAVVQGFGLGYHVKALWERMPGDSLLIVAEPDVGVLRAALEVEDYAEMLGSRQLVFFTALDRAMLVEQLEPRSMLLLSSSSEATHYSFENVKFAVHNASAQVRGEFHRAFQRMFVEFVAYIRTGFITVRENNKATCRNVANNLGRYVTTPPLDLLRDAFKGKPAVLVAAGPSLAKNMHLLHELVGNQDGTMNDERGTLNGETRNDERGTLNDEAGTFQRSSFSVQRSRRAVIIAVQTMLKPLLAAGMEPDFVTSLDYNTVSTRFFENLEESGSTGYVHLVAEAKANWNVLDVFGAGGGTMSVAHNDFAAKLLREAFGPRAGLKAGATVAHLSFYLAEFLGCDPIILVGQDLGFVDGLYYKPGTAIHETWGVELGRFNTLETKEWERIVRSRAILRKIPDIHGHPMYTEEQFFVYLQQFERDFAASRCRVIDATEGGAKKQGVEVMTLRAAIDGFCGKEGGGSWKLEDRPWKTWTCDVVGTLERLRETLGLRRKEAEQMKETCAATVPVLEEMLKCQKDEGRMRELFVEVDRLRSHEKADPHIRDMICEVALFGEMGRFHADLGVKNLKGDPLERQRRQLLRDIDYVNSLRVGAERVLEILEDAPGRVERQMAAARAGKPWPREVAGA